MQNLTDWFAIVPREREASRNRSSRLYLTHRINVIVLSQSLDTFHEIHGIVSLYTIPEEIIFTLFSLHESSNFCIVIWQGVKRSSFLCVHLIKSLIDLDSICNNDQKAAMRIFNALWISLSPLGHCNSFISSWQQVLMLSNFPHDEKLRDPLWLLYLLLFGIHCRLADWLRNSDS